MAKNVEFAMADICNLEFAIADARYAGAMALRDRIEIAAIVCDMPTTGLLTAYGAKMLMTVGKQTEITVAANTKIGEMDGYTLSVADPFHLYEICSVS